MSGSIVAGPEAGLVDLSRGGALLDVPARLSLGSAVRLKLTQSGRELGVFLGRVAWQRVASIAGGQINYRVAVAFEQPLPELPGAEPPRPQDPPQRNLSIVAGRDAHAPAPEPAVEQKAEAPQATAPAVDEIQKKLAAATADLACQTAILESLAGKLKESEQQRAALAEKAAEAVRKGGALFAALEARERKHAEALRAQQEKHEAAVVEALHKQEKTHEAAVAQALREQQEQHEAAVAEALRMREETHEAAVARALREQQEKHEAAVARALREQQEQHEAALAEALSMREETHEAAVAQALREQQEKHEGIVAQLIQATNEQQAEYEALLQQAAAAKDHEAERGAAANTRIRELEGRLEEAEMLCAAQQDRFRALRNETEQLMRMIDAASACGEERAESTRVAS